MSQTAAASAEPDRNRLTIGHLLLWMTTTGISIAAFQSESALNAASWNLLGDGLLLALTPIFGAAMSTVPIVATRWLRGGKPFLVQPGHWLLFAMGLVVLSTLALAAVSRFAGEPLEFAIVLVWFLCSTVTAMLLLRASTNQAFPRLWRISLAAWACVMAACVLMECVMPLHGPLILLFAFLALVGMAVLTNCVAIIADILTMVGRYDLFHFAGAIAWPVTSAIAVTLFLAF